MGRTAKTKKIDEPLKEESLDFIVQGLKNSIGVMSSPDSWFLHSGNYALDYVMSMKVDGTGGYPSGQTCEFFGDPSTGKTLLLLKAGAEMQKRGGLFAFADVERRYDPAFGALNGVDNDKLLLFHPPTVEDFTIQTYDLLNSINGKIKVLVALDSLAALSTIKEMEDVSEEKEMKADQGRRAQKIKQAMRVLPGLVSDTKSILLLSNHIIDNPGGYGKDTPGGRGSKFHSTVRLELLKSTPILLKDKERPIGVTLRVRVAKNSAAPPFGECEMELTWRGGLEPYSGLLDIAVDLGIIAKSGSWKKYGDVAFYDKDFIQLLQEHPEILQDERWAKPYFL